MKQTDDLRIAATKELIAPVQIHEQFPLTETAAETTFNARDEIQKIMAVKTTVLSLLLARVQFMIRSRH